MTKPRQLLHAEARRTSRSVYSDKGIRRYKLDSGPMLIFPSRGSYLSIEASLPKLVYGNNINALPAHLACEALSKPFQELVELVQLEQEGLKVEESPLARLDIVRDFDDVSHIQELILGHDSVYRPGFYVDVPHDGDSPVRALYIKKYRGAGSGGKWVYETKSYGKHAENPAAPVGRFRYEVTLRHGATGTLAKMAGGRMTRVRDVTEERLEAVARATFEDARMGATVVLPDGRSARLSFDHGQIHH